MLGKKNIIASTTGGMKDDAPDYEGKPNTLPPVPAVRDDTVTMSIDMVARVQRLLHHACTEWQGLPKLSSCVLNDDVDLRARLPVTSNHTTATDDSESLPDLNSEGELKYDKWVTVHTDLPDLVTWTRFPSAVVWVVPGYELSDERDIPTITVDGDVFDAATHTVVSGYGDLATCSTKYDPDVRLCRELAARDGVTVTFPYPANNPLAAFLPHVQALLFPTTPITLRLKKINVYGTGGHFVRHVDTPREGVLGTLVLHPYTGGYVPYGEDPGSSGGALVLGGGTRPLTVWGTTYSLSAFYSDVPHEVTRVTSERYGDRVTIVYDIVRGSVMVPPVVVPRTSTMRPPSRGSGTPDDTAYINIHAVSLRLLPSLPATLAAMTRVRRLLDSQESQPVRHVALLCMSSYSYDEVAMGVPKGSDVVLMQHMQSWGYRDIAIVPVLVRHRFNVYSEKPKDGSELAVVRATKEDLLTCVSGGAAAVLPVQYLVIAPDGASQVLRKAFEVRSCGGRCCCCCSESCCLFPVSAEVAAASNSSSLTDIVRH